MLFINASHVARAMTGMDDFSTIEKGRRGDVIRVTENPLHKETLEEMMGVGN